jgi:hypothetical protein
MILIKWTEAIYKTLFRMDMVECQVFYKVSAGGDSCRAAAAKVAFFPPTSGDQPVSFKKGNRKKRYIDKLSYLCIIATKVLQI